MCIERWVAFWRDELLFYTVFDSRRKEMGRRKRKQVEDEMRAALAVVKVPDPDRFIPKNEDLGCKRVAPSHSYLQVRVCLHYVTKPCDISLMKF